jgi:very-short-patch-repair endonuclease
MKNCEYCKKEHDGSYGSGRFCSSKCAKGFSTKNKRKEINEKVRKKITKEPLQGICLNCNTKFILKRKGRKFCCRSCSISYSNKNCSIQKRKKLSELAIKRHKNNDKNFGFTTRKKFEMSYPEKIAAKKLNELNIEYVSEYKVGRYFIDFALLKDKIAIEIDGQQHELKDRKESDKNKDNFLKNIGWKVYRIKYPYENIRKNIEIILQK